MPHFSSRKRVSAMFVILLVTGLTLVFLAIFNGNRTTSREIETPDLSLISDGTYRGFHNSFPVSAEVEVTVRAHEIVDITLLKHYRGRGWDAEALPAKVIESQSLEIDGISGSTMSSEVILRAIAKALASGIRPTS